MKNTLAKILQILLYFIMFAGMVGVFYACYTLAPNGDVGQMVLLFVLLAVFFLFSLVFIPVLHEVGHLVLGKLCGMKLISVRLFAWEIIRVGEILTCELVNPFTASTAGECRMYPTDREGMQKKYLCFALGGLLFQLVYLPLRLPSYLSAITPIYGQPWALPCRIAPIFSWSIYCLFRPITTGLSYTAYAQRTPRKQ